jgi:hypothetical protein
MLGMKLNHQATLVYCTVAVKLIKKRAWTEFDFTEVRLAGVNPTNFKFTPTTPVLYVVGKSVFTSEKNNFYSKNTLSYVLVAL